MQLSTLANQIDNDPELKARIAEDPAGALRTVAAGAPLQTDVHIYRIVVCALGLALVFGMVGALVLAYFGKAVPAEATALGSASVGALAGLLAPSPHQ